MDITKFNNIMFREFLDSFYDGVWITDGEGKILLVNKALKRISNISKEQVEGKKTEQILSEGIIRQSVVLNVLKQKKVISLVDEYNNTTSIATGSPIFNNNCEIVSVIVSIRDINELNIIKRELNITPRVERFYQEEMEILQNQLCIESSIVAQSEEMLNTLKIALRSAKFDTPVLITGDTGVGKEIVAKLIHNLSSRADKLFVKIDCGALPPNLLESELFGYVKGAFTGAKNEGKIGMVELADGGTLFLDEIGNMPLHIQMKLLRVLETGEYFRLGSTTYKKVNMRLISATNANLEKLIISGQFREDLYFRINVIPIYIPNLRQRKEDIPPLITHFLNTLNEKYKLNKRFTEESVKTLVNYNWPGNVRELKNTIERLVVLCKEDLISPGQISNYLPGKLDHSTEVINMERFINLKNKTLKDIMYEVECNVIMQVMHKYKTSTKAAQVLGISQPTVSRKLKKMQSKYHYLRHFEYMKDD